MKYSGLVVIMERGWTSKISVKKPIGSLKFVSFPELGGEYVPLLLLFLFKLHKT